MPRGVHLHRHRLSSLRDSSGSLVLGPAALAWSSAGRGQVLGPSRLSPVGLGDDGIVDEPREAGSGLVEVGSEWASEMYMAPGPRSVSYPQSYYKREMCWR